MIPPSQVRISVSGPSCLLAAAALLILPLKLLTGALLAAAIHESCHLLALRLFRVGIRRIQINFGGAVIEASALTPLQELLCAAAGPAGSFLCLLVIRRYPLLALCGCLQGLYNLLPVYPLDGGRILFSLLQLAVPDKADRFSRTISRSTVAAMLGICLFLYLRTFRILFLLLGGYFLYSTGFIEKLLAKKADIEYNER